MARNSFNAVGGLKPRRNVFDLSYRTNFTCDMGELIPVMNDEVVPGDHFTIGSEVVIRFQPLIAPIMHEITATVHYFFVPYRILWDKWEEFISGEFGLTDLPYPLPRANPRDYTVANGFRLWDYFGMPLCNTPAFPVQTYEPFSPIDMPWRAYARIWNEYYRDQDLQDEVPDGMNTTQGSTPNKNVLRRNWRKDYFTSARPFRQKGVAPALPVNVDVSLAHNPNIPYSPVHAWNSATNMTSEVQAGAVGSVAPNWGAINWLRTDNSIYSSPQIGSVLGTSNEFTALSIGANATATTFNVSDLRLAFQTQKWLERNARAGTRYTEFLRSHFGVSPSDSRLDRPEYIGGVKVPVQISEVVQTSETTSESPQANMSGHGLAADGSLAGKYFVPEFGIIMGLLSVMPKPCYQNGMDRQWLRELPSDFYFPEFCRLSEQGVHQAEIFYGFGGFDDRAVFGYTGQYDEMRTKHDRVCSEMRATPWVNGLPWWNLSRFFDNDNVPNLNSEFITCNPDKRIFADPSSKGLIVNVYNRIRAVRPMPSIADPGLIDHY